MTKNVLEFLEQSAEKYPEKTAFSDEKGSVTYHEFMEAAQRIGSSLLGLNIRNKPVAVLLKKSVACLECMMGVAYSGNFYVVVDINTPADRINAVFSSLSPASLLTDEETLEKVKEINYNAPVVLYESAVHCPADGEGLAAVRRRQIDTDPLYALFTSGSTGLPKGTVVCHRSVIDYAEWVTQTFDINSETVFGSQTPFYFSMSVLDIFSTLKSAAALQLIPKQLFSFPLKLLEFLVEKEINTVYWVPSALSIVANWKALDYVELPKLTKVLFAGEVMPVKQLNVWRRHLPWALFANLYGPTEITDICTYYIVDREFDDAENLPIGKACDNCDVFLLKEDGTQAGPGEEGELCVRGSFLGLGYYNNPEKTAQVFIQNPVNPHYPELIYKTGDLVRVNEYGEFMYIARTDFQIKRMGYRIELGEIEAAANSANGVSACACLYNREADSIDLFYSGTKADDETILKAAREKLPAYMMPNKVIFVRQMPYNANGKIDRLALKNL